MPITHQWNGTVLTITSDSGTSSADLKGDDGVRGAQGKPGGTCYNVSVAPRNWLDNSYFANPINQRGKTNYSGTWTYCIDRWRTTTTGEGKVWVSTGNVGIPPNGRIIQCIDVNKADWVGKKFTFAAALTTGAIYIGSGTIQEQNAETVYHINVNYNGLRVRLYSVDNSNYMYATIINETAYNQPFVWVALYEGEYTADTLPQYYYKGYAAELAECMRYYQQSFVGSVPTYNGSIIKQAATNNTLQSVDFDVPMRILPTITIYSPHGQSGTVMDWTNDINIAKTDVKGLYATEKRFIPQSTGAFTTGASYALHYTASADL